MTAHLDDCGNPVQLGDHVKVTALNTDRGAYLGLTGAPGEVVGFGRTRVQVQFGSRTGTDAVGGEYLHIVKPADGRHLRTWDDVHAERALRALITCERCGRTTTDPDLWDPEADTGRIFCNRCWPIRNAPVAAR